MKKIVIPIVIIVIFILFALIFDWGRTTQSSIDFNNLATTSTIKQLASNLDMPILVKNIKDNQGVTSPIHIEGKARGNWFFEATFPIELVDTDGNMLASVIARAESDWMTTDYVNFTADIEYNKSTTTSHALIILKNDNPSGLPEFDQSIFIPVILK